jgi:hypothetical protein
VAFLLVKALTKESLLLHSIYLSSAPKVLHDVLITSSRHLNCTSLKKTWTKAEKTWGDFRCQSLESTRHGNRPTMPMNGPPTGRGSILKVLAAAAILVFICVAFRGGSRWDLWLILSMNVGVWSLVGNHLDIRSDWIAPLLPTQLFQK